MAETVRWSLDVSRETDAALRQHLAQRGLPESDIVRFVEEAVRWQLLDQMAQDVKANNLGVPAEVLHAEIEEAIQAVRSGRFDG